MQSSSVKAMTAPRAWSRPRLRARASPGLLSLDERDRIADGSLPREESTPGRFNGALLTIISSAERPRRSSTADRLASSLFSFACGRPCRRPR